MVHLKNIHTICVPIHGAFTCSSLTYILSIFSLFSLIHFFFYIFLSILSLVVIVCLYLCLPANVTSEFPRCGRNESLKSKAFYFMPSILISNFSQYKFLGRKQQLLPVFLHLPTQSFLVAT